MPTKRLFAKVGIVVGFVTAIAGCSQGASIHTSSVQKSVPADTAYVLPPPGGPAIVHVLERGYSNAIQQEISLATDSSVAGQNYFRVKLFGDLDPKEAGDGHTSSRSLALTNIGSEMRSAVRGVAMSKSPYFVQNRYGPFGYGIGRSGNDLCLYGWQNLRSRPALIGNKGSVDIRLRLCGTNATERELLAVMYGYTVNAYLSDSNWNPYGSPPAVPETLGAAGPDVYPVANNEFQTVAPEPTVTPRRVRRVQRQEAPPPPVVEEEPIGPAVPPPPGVSDAPAVPPPPVAEAAH
ncbi:cellulose biosynthesis protein BcsN [Mesorhizobium yinganensis]|uniref:cellulose biosynthesis protein BcsN n=1 Tax=Mesorhizobium yinganensis TaxID=3157707 RepID=UPI0032B82549